jgi:hypothetical protein
MKTNLPVRDERTIAVENASYRWGFNLMAFGSLVIVAYRGFFLQESLWDLMLLVIVASGISTVYQARERLFTRRTVLLMVLIGVFSAALSVLIVFLMATTRPAP